MRLAQVDAFPHVLSGKDERYTLPDTMAQCMRLARVDGWDLDVAACEAAHHAPRWYSKAEDGLSRRWFGRVWCNPPFSDVKPWLLKARQELWSYFPPEVVAMLLPANRAEQPWWQELVEPYRDQEPLAGWPRLRTHFLPKRIRFGSPEQPSGITGSPEFGCVLLVWRPAL